MFSHLKKLNSETGCGNYIKNKRIFFFRIIRRSWRNFNIYNNIDFVYMALVQNKGNNAMGHYNFEILFNRTNQANK